MNLNGDTLIILKNSVMFILINLSKLYILLFCIVTITKVCAEPPKLYKETLNPISYLAYENQAFVEPIPFTDSPIIKINITQPGDKDTQCAVYPSVPDITKTSTYAFINSVEPAQMFSFNNYIYLVDKSLSVSILENTWNSSGASSQLKKVSTIPKPVTIQNRVSEDVTVILSEATGSMQIWTANQVFMYAMSNGGRGLRFLNDRGTGGTGPNTWLKYHINGEFIYIVYKDKTDAVTRFTIAESIEDIFVDETPLFSSLGIEILDFYATDKYIYILEANKGVHVYSLDSTSQPKKLTFIDEPDGKKVLAVDQTLIMITEATKRQYTHFEAVEYIRFEASSDLFTQNNKRRFPGEFVGSISVDDTRVLLLNNNIMFTWYHSIPSQLQPSQDDLLSSYIFYGASGFFIEKFYADNSEFIYTRMQGELQSHKISNKSPQIGCSRSTFQQFSPQTLTLNLVMNSLTCPSKTKSKDNGINSLCVYYQEVTITQASGAAQGRSIFFWNFNGIRRTGFQPSNRSYATLLDEVQIRWRFL